jgi:hypothetical protein
MVDTPDLPSLQAENAEIPAAIYEEIASWRRIFSQRQPSVDAKDLLRNAVRELWRVLEIDRTVHPRWHENTRQETIDALYEMAKLADISDDDAQKIFSESFAAQPTPQAENVFDIGTLNDPHLNRYDAPVLSLGGGNEAARVHQFAQRLSGRLATGRSCATARADAEHRRAFEFVRG